MQVHLEEQDQNQALNKATRSERKANKYNEVLIVQQREDLNNSVE